MIIELKDVNTNKLHDELIAVGIIPKLVESLDNTTWVTVEDSQESAVMAVVAVHDPTPKPQPVLPTSTDLQKQIFDLTTQLVIGGVI